MKVLRRAYVAYCGWPGHALARFVRLLVFASLFAVAFLVSFHASAAECSSSWSVTNTTLGDGPYVFEWGTTPAEVCSGAQAWANIWGSPGTVSACSGSQSSVTWTATNTNGAFAFSAVNAAGADCTSAGDPPDPPASSASSGELTQGQALNFIAYGLVLLVGVAGYIAGRI